MVEQRYIEGPDWHGITVKWPIGSRCNILQYRLLKRCSERKNTKLWNRYYGRYRGHEFQTFLQGANLKEVHLKGAYLPGAHLEYACLDKAHLEYACLEAAHLEYAHLNRAHLEHAFLNDACLEHANMGEAYLEHANLAAYLNQSNLQFAHLEHSNLQFAYLEHANLLNAYLEHADLKAAHLQKANLSYAHLDGADLFLADITGTCFICASLSNTTISEIDHFDTSTDFSKTNLTEARMCPKLQSQFEYNIRRKYWGNWCRGEEFIRQLKKSKGIGEKIKCLFRAFWRKQVTGRLVSCFWWTSDYGTNSMRLLGAFFFLSMLFAVIYWLCPECAVGLKNIATNDSVNVSLVDISPVDVSFVDISYGDASATEVSPQMLLLRAFYFSVVTMTTLGFGDIHAAPNSILGHVLLIIQVFLGYILLGAFITRFGILFMSKAPCPKVPRAKVKSDC